MTHALKTWPEYYKAIEDESKTFECRKDDRGFKVGDHLLLQEFDIDGKCYTGKEWEGQITYLLRDFIGLKKGYVIFGIKKLERF